MENEKEKTAEIDEMILKKIDLIEQEKELKFVNLMIEIIVSITLKQYYEKGN